MCNAFSPDKIYRPNGCCRVRDICVLTFCSNAHDIGSFIVRVEIPSIHVATPMQFNCSRDHSNRSLGSLTVVARCAPQKVHSSN